MGSARLEHINITVEKPVELAKDLNRLFGWTVRWEGGSIKNGYTVLVGEENSYLALFTPDKLTGEPVEPYFSDRATNHIGVLVDDLDATRAIIGEMGLQINDENENEPGRRIYFLLHGIEFEALQY